MICKECGRECANYASLGTHLYYSHKNISKEDYYKKYLTEDQDCDKCKYCGRTCNFINLKLGFHLYCSSACQRTSPETYKKSKETRNAHFGEGHWRSAKGNDKMAEANRKNAKRRAKKLKKTYLERTGFLHPSQNPEVALLKNKKYTYKEINFDSSWELAYFIWLSDNKKKFSFHDIQPIEYKFNDVIHKYFPDFMTEDGLVEIKSPLLFEQMQVPETIENAKYQCMMENNVKIITDCSEYLEYVNNTYGRDYLQQFRNQ